MPGTGPTYTLSMAHHDGFMSADDCTYSRQRQPAGKSLDSNADEAELLMEHKDTNILTSLGSSRSLQVSHLRWSDCAAGSASWLRRLWTSDADEAELLVKDMSTNIPVNSHSFLCSKSKADLTQRK